MPDSREEASLSFYEGKVSVKCLGNSNTGFGNIRQNILLKSYSW